ncbi:MAG: bifunctional pantoate--beta-alanine ligase/(d)CMP kinase [Cyanobacteria bacterium MAG IRC3_bin_20]|nr:bifunctional pantoate--beta-alanine ligase/(d)CMP kinase [Cyanobacteria bacterium MAG IRC3_bin_20]
MVILHSNGALDQWLAAAGGPVHFVPTMGGLHRGHRQLIRAARGVGGRVLVSVFVNPAQFAAGEDFTTYPKHPDGDAQQASAAGADAVWFPAVEHIYGDAGDANPERGPTTSGPQPEPSLIQTLCGPWRPGHFEGVLMVMERLLERVQPAVVVMGEKDWQQLTVLRQCLPAFYEQRCRLLPVPMVREEDGLPCSSRNCRLSPAQRRQAALVPQALRAAAAAVHAGERRATVLEQLVRGRLKAAGLEVDYAQLVHPLTLQPCPRLDGVALLGVAVHVGPARLLDHSFLLARKPIIAIDGPAGTGKSTVTRLLAARLGLLHLDTGAMYRAVAWLMLESRQPIRSGGALQQLLETMELQLAWGDHGQQVIRINGVDVSDAIRLPRVTATVPRVAALPEVRQVLTRQQRMFGRQGGLVSEGRDMGTAVFPQAELKVYLTATAAERARRRAADMTQRGQAPPPLATLEAQITERDHLDCTRTEAPLRPAEDGVVVATDGISVEQVVDKLEDLFRQRVSHDAWPAGRH